MDVLNVIINLFCVFFLLYERGKIGHNRGKIFIWPGGGPEIGGGRVRKREEQHQASKEAAKQRYLA